MFDYPTPDEELITPELIQALLSCKEVKGQTYPVVCDACHEARVGTRFVFEQWRGESETRLRGGPIRGVYYQTTSTSKYLGDSTLSVCSGCVKDQVEDAARSLACATRNYNVGGFGCAAIPSYFALAFIFANVPFKRMLLALLFVSPFLALFYLVGGSIGMLFIDTRKQDQVVKQFLARVRACGSNHPEATYYVWKLHLTR